MQIEFEGSIAMRERDLVCTAGLSDIIFMSLFFLVVTLPVSHAVYAEEEETAIVQDFEQDLALGKWPDNNPGSVTLSSDWKADGRQSLKIDAGLMATISDFKLSNWQGCSVLRFRVNNTTGKALTLGIELQDQNTDFRDRHQNSVGVGPGEQTVELDIASGLWRGQEDLPYRGEIKTPIDTSQITRLAFTNQGTGTIYIDKIEVVKEKPIRTSGGFAFDFGKSNSQTMRQFTGVFEDTLYTPERGYGMVGDNASCLTKVMSYPTPMLGKGLALPGKGFRVDLPGGNYIGWVAFERAGFWENEYCGYTHAALKVNGVTVHEHDYSRTGRDFLFQDTEITDMAQLADRLIWPAHAISAFKFEAAKGANVFTIELKDSNEFPLRIAGLILAPDTGEGKAFIKAHEELQKKVITQTFLGQDRGRRGEGRAAPAGNLVCEPLPAGYLMYPHDWPSQPKGAQPDNILAVNGQTVTLLIGAYARKELTLTVSGTPLKGPGGPALVTPAISHGRYMPNRHYVGGAWLEVNHYHPEPTFAVGPQLSRPILVEYDIPQDARPGDYSGTVEIFGGGERCELPVSIKVAAVELPPIPIAVGLESNALPFPPENIGEDAWWKLQESLLKEQSRAGLNYVVGGAGLLYKIEEKDGKCVFSGERELKYLSLAKKYGMDKAVLCITAFIRPLKKLPYNPKAFCDGLKAFEEENHLPPHFLYGYDEPRTDAELKSTLEFLRPFSDAGAKALGFTEFTENNPAWEEVIKYTYAPSLNVFDEAFIKSLKAQGKHPWTYNIGVDRYNIGLGLWREIQIGIEGREEWIGIFTQGFAFNNLDGREPSSSCFLMHSKFGVLKTPLWLGGREGLLDVRLRLALEKAVPADDPVLKLWAVEGLRKDREKWSDAELDKVRVATLEKLDATARNK
jgi:hypothetical protein